MLSTEHRKAVSVYVKSTSRLLSSESHREIHIHPIIQTSKASASSVNTSSFAQLHAASSASSARHLEMQKHKRVSNAESVELCQGLELHSMDGRLGYETHTGTSDGVLNSEEASRFKNTRRCR